MLGVVILIRLPDLSRWWPVAFHNRPLGGMILISLPDPSPGAVVAESFKLFSHHNPPIGCFMSQAAHSNAVTGSILAAVTSHGWPFFRESGNINSLTPQNCHAILCNLDGNFHWRRDKEGRGVPPPFVGF